MSDKNPSTKPILFAIGVVRDDVYEHVFDRIQGDMRVIGLMCTMKNLKNLRGKKVVIEIRQERM